jgi:hypothetical protein
MMLEPATRSSRRSCDGPRFRATLRLRNIGNDDGSELHAIIHFVIRPQPRVRDARRWPQCPFERPICQLRTKKGAARSELFCQEFWLGLLKGINRYALERRFPRHCAGHKLEGGIELRYDRAQVSQHLAISAKLHLS